MAMLLVASSSSRVGDIRLFLFYFLIRTINMVVDALSSIILIQKLEMLGFCIYKYSRKGCGGLFHSCSSSIYYF